MMLQEEIPWPVPPREYLVVVSDGLDTGGGKPVQIGSDAIILLSNSSGEEGIFKSFVNHSFESTDSAIRFIINDISSEEVSGHD